MPGLVPGIHALLSWYSETSKTWMPATSAGMTELFVRAQRMRADEDGGDQGADQLARPADQIGEAISAERGFAFARMGAQQQAQYRNADRRADHARRVDQPGGRSGAILRHARHRDVLDRRGVEAEPDADHEDRKSTRLNSSH